MQISDTHFGVERPPVCDALRRLARAQQPGVLLAVGDTLVAGMGARLSGLNPGNGQPRWEVPVASARGVNEIERLIDLVGPAARVQGTVCVRAFQSAVGCVDAQRGALAGAVAGGVEFQRGIMALVLELMDEVNMPELDCCELSTCSLVPPLAPMVPVEALVLDADTPELREPVLL